ncbi:hypothetical protein M422DRAFT_28382 [Sphaerobolus stellatus SS14]|uniref:Uncharacterized protein n=1 Tax=Sphaerobolus stellatus (strain SS14) TaxID=990650 RepID=A0A0C9VWT2_SPHS4|nr:hypothetical protein M422DRAFT_30956 [Sphaerobolus stellatus SS14]KIJ48714.1 hypothetical protein M422DRAFT_28382 [Sphaerobolus stellatus SS14]
MIIASLGNCNGRFTNTHPSFPSVTTLLSLLYDEEHVVATLILHKYRYDPWRRRDRRCGNRSRWGLGERWNGSPWMPAVYGIGARVFGSKPWLQHAASLRKVIDTLASLTLPTEPHGRDLRRTIYEGHLLAAALLLASGTLPTKSEGHTTP